MLIPPPVSAHTPTLPRRRSGPSFCTAGLHCILHSKREIARPVRRRHSGCCGGGCWRQRTQGTTLGLLAELMAGRSTDAGIILLGFSVSIGRRSCMGLSLVLRVYILMREGASRPVVNTNNVDGVFLLIYPEDDAVRVMRGAVVR